MLENILQYLFLLTLVTPVVFIVCVIGFVVAKMLNKTELANTFGKGVLISLVLGLIGFSFCAFSSI